jgi:hypothetical protein
MHTGTGARVAVRVVPVPSLPDGRRVARLDGPSQVTFLVLEGQRVEDIAEELQQVMQDGLDCGLYEQHWGDASVTPPQPISVS